MSKDEIKALIDSQSQSLKDAVDSLPSGDQGELIAQLQAQVADLSGKVDQAVASLSEEIAKEADLQSQKDASDAKIAKAIQDLQGA